MSIARRMLILLAVCGLLLTGCETGEETDVEVGEEEVGTDLGTETTALGGWDTDANAMLDENEFRQAGYYNTWNTNTADDLTEDEVETGFGNAGLFEDWDADNDNMLSQNEFGFGETEWFDTWDVNDDQMLNEDEYYGGTYETWDTNDDSLLDEDEYYGGLYNAWDTDDSGYIEETEYTTGSGWFE